LPDSFACLSITPSSFYGNHRASAAISARKATSGYNTNGGLKNDLRSHTVNSATIDAYEAGGAQLRKAVAGLSPEQLRTRLEPGKWSILENVIHLADSDAIAIDRMKRMLIEDNPPLLYADETAYIDRLYPHDQSLDDALDLFEIGRRQFARTLRKLSAEAMERHGTHDRSGRKTVGGMVESYIQHLDHHLKFIEAKRAKLLSARSSA
jgi:hypothetical protein